ncbi:unnamed protein product, partial [Ixodes pacificus]
MRASPHDGRAVREHRLGPQHPPFRHEVVEVVEALAKLVGLQGPAEVRLGVQGAPEVRLGEGDGDEAAAVTQHPAHLRKDSSYLPKDKVHLKLRRFRQVPGVPLADHHGIERGLLYDHIEGGVREVQLRGVHDVPLHLGAVVAVGGHVVDDHSRVVYVLHVPEAVPEQQLAQRAVAAA